MKRLFTLLLTILMLSCSVLCTAATETPLSGTKTTIEYLENGDYIKTVITWEESNTRASKTASKTATFYNNSDVAIWSLTVTGTFTYNGTTSSCTSCSHSTAIHQAGYALQSASSSKSGNTATATGVAVTTLAFVSMELPITTKLTCSANGTLS